VTGRYGKDHVAQIITFGTMQARAAIRDVGRAMNIPYSEVDKVAKLVPLVLKITLKTALDMEPQLKELYTTNPEIKELIDIAQKLEGISRHASTHAAGIVISPDPLTDFLPLYKAPNDEAVVTQFDMSAIKKLGLLKFDFLGLKTLTIIDKAEKIINASAGDGTPGPFTIKDIALDDRESFNLLCDARTSGVFQLESSGMKDLLKRLRPGAFEDLIALVALYRPGPLGSGMVDEFIQGKNAVSSSPGAKPAGSLAKLGLPQLDDILKETHGIILYQEQVMEIAHKMANFTLAQADILRKAMGGKNPEEMERMKNTFIQGLKSNRVSEKKAETLYTLILQFAQYGFNKSHSAAYALIAYQTAWLKAHYPVEFMAASLSADMDNTAKVVIFINECRDMGIEILPPAINESGREFTVSGNSIRFGLEAVKGVGSSAIDAILEVRNEKPFRSLSDLCVRADSRRVNKKVLESLIKAGALDSMGTRAQLMSALPDVMESAMRAQREKNLGQESMFGDVHDGSDERLPAVEEWRESKLLAMEKEALGFYITGHPLSKYADVMSELGCTPTHEIQELRDRQELNICGLVRESKQIQTKKTGDLMAYVTLEDMYGTAEVIAFPDTYRESQGIVSQEEPVIVSGYTDRNDKGLKIIAQKIVSIHNRDQINRPTGSVPFRKQGNGRAAFQKSRAVKPDQKWSALTLTLLHSEKTDTLSELDRIFSRYTGDCTVYLKIISPRNWETVLKTNRQITPSPEMISETELLIGKGKAVLN
jgi:DNA polymerase-3 subunit alpha